MMLPLSPARVRTVLLVGAHPDDIELGCGGTVLQLAASRPDLRVHWVVMSGAGGRRAEAEGSAARFLAGVADPQVVVHDFDDSFFPYAGRALKDAFHELAARVAPDVIFTHHRQDLHQDHRLVSELTTCAFRGPLVLEYEIPKYDADLGQPNVFVPIAADVAERKIQGILDGFPSQHAKPWFDAETFRSLLRLRGLECSSASRYAEGFHCRKLTLAFDPPA